MNKYKLALSALTALCFNATTNGCKVQAATVSYVQTIAPNASWAPPVPPPLTTAIKLTAIVFHHWYLDAHNDTSNPVLWDLSVSHAVVVNTTAALHGLASTSNFTGTMPAFSSSLIDADAVVTLEYTYTLPVDINAFSSNTTIAVNYWLEYTPTGITIPTTFPSPDNVTQITVTYTYDDPLPPVDDDDCDHDKDHDKKPKKHKHEKKH